jgi:hypothetical protein
MTLRMRFKCGDKRHTIRIEDNGDIVLASHPSIEMLESFIAFGAKPPKCLKVYRALRKDPLLFFSFDKRASRAVRFLAVEYAQHALKYVSDDDPAFKPTLETILDFAENYYMTPYKVRRSKRIYKWSLQEARDLAKKARRSAECRGNMEWNNIEDREDWAEPLDPGSLHKLPPPPSRRQALLPVPPVIPVMRDVVAHYNAFADAAVAMAVDHCLHPTKKATSVLNWVGDETAYAASLASGYVETQEELLENELPEREWQRRRLMQTIATLPPGSVKLHFPRRRGRWLEL